MWELLAVLVIYFIVSFVGMCVIWTAAVRKDLVPAPSYFFWIRAKAIPIQTTAGNEGFPNACWNSPIGLAAATMVLFAVISTVEPLAQNTSNQIGDLNALPHFSA